MVFRLGVNNWGLEYSSIYLTHALFGVCQTWIAHGKKESSQEITDFLMKMLGDTN
ncbi:TetR family transcriptional regulator [Streptococcus pneumoniae]|nr:TetR family transcriptional regulator [Streptococcus pneumoniae]